MGAAELTILLSFLEAGIRLYEKATAGKTPEELNAMAATEEARTITVRAAFDKEFGGSGTE
jgi:hypothetical protein